MIVGSGLVVFAGLIAVAKPAEGMGAPFEGSLSTPVFPGAVVVELGELPGPHGLPLRARLFVADAALEAVLAHYVEAMGAPDRTVVGHVIGGGLAYVAWADDVDGRLRVLTLVRSDGRTHVFPSDIDPEAVFADASGAGNRALSGETAVFSIGGESGPESRSFLLPVPVEEAASRLRERFEREGYVARAEQSVPGRMLLVLERDSEATAMVVVTAIEEGSRVTVQLSVRRVRGRRSLADQRLGRRQYPERHHHRQPSGIPFRRDGPPGRLPPGLVEGPDRPNQW